MGAPYEDLLQRQITGQAAAGLHDTVCALSDSQDARHVPGYALKRDVEEMMKVRSVLWNGTYPVA